MLNWHTFKNGTIIYINKTVAADTFEHKELHPWQSLQEISLQACANATGRWRMTLSHCSLLPSISASEHQNWWSKLKKRCHQKGEQSAAATVCQRHNASRDREVSQQEHSSRAQSHCMQPPWSKQHQQTEENCWAQTPSYHHRQLAWAQSPHPLNLTQQWAEGISSQSEAQWKWRGKLFQTIVPIPEWESWAEFQDRRGWKLFRQIEKPVV